MSVWAALAERLAEPVAEDVEGMTERIEQLELIESAFDLYRERVTTALGVDPKSCAEDVGEAIEELKLKIVGLEAMVAALKAKNAQQAENAEPTTRPDLKLLLPIDIEPEPNTQADPFTD